MPGADPVDPGADPPEPGPDPAGSPVAGPPMVVVPVADLSAALEFYRGVLGQPQFRDGDRWAQFAGPPRIGLAGPGGGMPVDRTTLAVRVADRAAAADLARRAGATIADESSGPHEQVLVLRDAAGHELLAFVPHARPPAPPD